MTGRPSGSEGWRRSGEVGPKGRSARRCARVFGYTLVADDGSHGTMAVTANSLALNGGTIRSTQSAANAQLTHVGTIIQGRSTRNAGSQARFRNVPERHDGETSFTVGLGFSSAPLGLSARRDAASVLEVTGGSVTGARETTGGATPAWEVTVTPEDRDEVTVRLPVRSCDETHAVCIDGAPLSDAVEATVPLRPEGRGCAQRSFAPGCSSTCTMRTGMASSASRCAHPHWWSIFEAKLPRWKCEDCMTLQEAISTFGFEVRSKLSNSDPSG